MAAGKRKLGSRHLRFQMKRMCEKCEFRYSNRFLLAEEWFWRGTKSVQRNVDELWVFGDLEISNPRPFLPLKNGIT
jgi:hypothetical protein